MENQMLVMQHRQIRNKNWYQSLQEQKPKAIKHLAERLSSSIKQLSRINYLTREDTQELINDTILITIQKIQNGKFEFQDCSPLCYAMEVARKLLSNRLRGKKLMTVPLDAFAYAVSFDSTDYYSKKETELKIGQLLKQMGPNCEHIIRLKYYEELKDEEIVRTKLTDYNTVESLKVKRSQCLSKLKTMVRTNGITKSNLIN